MCWIDLLSHAKHRLGEWTGGDVLHKLLLVDREAIVEEEAVDYSIGEENTLPTFQVL